VYREKRGESHAEKRGRKYHIVLLLHTLLSMLLISVFRSVVSRFLSFSIRSDVCGVSISNAKLVTTGTCASNGYTRITDGDMCKAAAKAAGFTVTWGPHGGWGEVVDGCTMRSSSDLFLNPPGTCSKSALLWGKPQYCDCSNSYNKCLCDARGSTFRETTCMDKPLGWADKDGDTCAKYKSNKWCKPDGSNGIGWTSTAGSFSDWANSAGVDASQACCACGAGIKKYENFRVARAA
jgi:hypothetical protein